jgi:hypothetical protein
VATYLGRTGEDFSTGSAEGADGVLDEHIKLTNVPAPITHVIANGSNGGVWESPLNGVWIVVIRPQPDPSIVDLYLNYWSLNAPYTLDLTFANGARQTVQTINGVTPPKMPTGFKLQ